MAYIKLVLFLMLSLTELYAGVVDRAENFFSYLEKEEASLSSCQPILVGDEYRLCDQTVVSKKELTDLFKMSSKELTTYLQSKGIALDIYCANKEIATTFKESCTENPKHSELKKMSSLHGMYLPPENAILIEGSTTLGSLIHEYIHYKQFQNQNPLAGRRYKAERVEIQSELLREIDQAISKVQEIEKEGVLVEQKSAPYIKEVIKLSSLMQKFSKWQDLIDERSIFKLYLLFGKEFGASIEDLELAQKNMRYICRRADLKLGEADCPAIVEKPVSYYDAVAGVIKEIRQKPDLTKLDAFLRQAPKISPTLPLKEKISILNSYIYKKWKIRPDSDYRSIQKKDNILPDTTLVLKQAHCVGLTTLFLLLSQHVGLEASLVRIPEHVFPRICEKEVCYNVETLKMGELVDDEYYYKMGYIQKEQIVKTSYMQSLSGGRPLTSSLYLSLGYIAGSAKQWDLAKYLYEKSIDSGRDFAEGYINLAAVYAAQNQRKLARSYLVMAKKINPSQSLSYLNSALLDEAEGNFELALKEYAVAEKLNPTSYALYFHRYQTLTKMNNGVEALMDLKRALAVKPKECSLLKIAIEKITDLSDRLQYEKSLKQLVQSGACKK